MSQCEPAHARKIFPCVDEPCFKSIFQISLFVEHPTHIALSNTEVDSIETLIEGRWYHFKDTPLMSAYLVAIVIGRFDHIETYSKTSNIKVRAYTPVGLAW